MSFQVDQYREMISSFGTKQLNSLLGIFGQTRTGRKAELKCRAFDLLHMRIRPVGFNHQMFLTKIVKIYCSIEYDMFNNYNVNQKIVQQSITHKPMQYRCRPMKMENYTLPCVIPKMEKIDKNSNISGNNSIQCNHTLDTSHNIMPVNQHLSMRAPDQVGNVMNTDDNSNKLPESQSIINVAFKKLHFYEVVDEICQPSVLSGVKIKSSSNSFQDNMLELVHKIQMSPQQVNYILQNQHLPKINNQYYYQVNIRIGLLEPGSTELKDFLPLELGIKVSSQYCPLPPFLPKKNVKTENRRTPKPIDCTQLVKLNSKIPNIVAFNWIPDGKTYVWGVFLVKKLSFDILLKKLLNKGASSYYETKKKIIKHFADVDPDCYSSSSYIVSLMCPLSQLRIKIPVKSINCDHFKCFDAYFFLMMNQQNSTWICPICNKACDYDQLKIDSYFYDIVSNLPDSYKEIEVLNDGTWKVHNEKKKKSMDGYDDIIDLVDSDEDDVNSKIPLEPRSDDNKNNLLHENKVETSYSTSYN